MKTAIVYFSSDGNTEFVAREMSKVLDADLFKLEPKRGYPKSKVLKLFWGGKQTVTKAEPKLKEIPNLEGYDFVWIGTPIWVGTYTPVIRTFLSSEAEKLKEKNIGIFSSHGGGGSEKYQAMMKELFPNIKNVFEIQDPLRHKNKSKEIIHTALLKR